MKKTKVLLLIIILPIAYLLIFVSNFSGICKEEGRILTKAELIYKTLGPAYDHANCCHVAKASYQRKMIFLKALFGNRLYEISAESGGESLYAEINQCGEYVGDFFTMN